MKQLSDNSQVDFVAFRRTLLQSEKLRIICVLAFGLIVTILVSIRIFTFELATRIEAFAILGLYLGLELVALYGVKLELRGERSLRRRFWILTIMVEMSLPALGMAFLFHPQLEVAYRPVATPCLLGFFPLIILSALRLSWLASIAAGVAAAVAYLAAAFHLGWRIPLTAPRSLAVTQVEVLFYAAILLISGLIAAAVSNEIRKHVQAALREAETRRRLKEVEHDLEIARSIQQSLLPRVRPQIGGFEIAGWNRPADDTGGDYFDWTHLPDGRLVVTLADVTGHGIGPALLASVCRAYARASFNTQDDLVTTVQNVNRSLKEDLTPGRFATFVAAVCKESSEQVEILSAGHAPLFIYSSASQTIQKLPAQAVPLGICPDLNSPVPLITHLQPNDIILLITDGFFEWENDSGEQFGFERLEEVVRNASRFSPEEIIAKLYQAVAAFAKGSKQQDDLTAVVIKRVIAGTVAA